MIQYQNLKALGSTLIENAEHTTFFECKP